MEQALALEPALAGVGCDRLRTKRLCLRAALVPILIRPCRRGGAQELAVDSCRAHHHAQVPRLLAKRNDAYGISAKYA